MERGEHLRLDALRDLAAARAVDAFLNALPAAREPGMLRVQVARDASMAAAVPKAALA